MPGDTIQVIDNVVYIDGKKADEPEYIQFNYFVQTNGRHFTDEEFRKLGISLDDRQLAASIPFYKERLSYMDLDTDANGDYGLVYHLPLTNQALADIKKYDFVKKIVIEPEELGGMTYPVDYRTGWTRDNFGPLWIPKKGATIELTERNLKLYSRCIRNYENNTLEVDGNKVLINGKSATTYTFKYDYFFMMGDNRHNSADSRSWGFVPEDHIVGKPILIWLSLDKDRSLFDGGIRWNRLFTKVK